MDDPQVLDQMPAGGKVSTPDSGAYGEKAANDRLEASLPGVGGNEPTTQPTAAPPGMSPTASPTAPGLPPGLMAPTRNPDMPVSNPLSAGPAPVPQSTPEQKILVWDYLSKAANVSQETRDLAKLALSRLVRKPPQ